jgi:hypothetical protein
VFARAVGGAAADRSRAARERGGEGEGEREGVCVSGWARVFLAGTALVPRRRARVTRVRPLRSGNNYGDETQESLRRTLSHIGRLRL